MKFREPTKLHRKSGYGAPGVPFGANGKHTPGAKARHFLKRFTARLKSCPDTKPGFFAVRKANPSIKILLLG
jgi:hypothetical protein